MNIAKIYLDIISFVLIVGYENQLKVFI